MASKWFFLFLSVELLLVQDTSFVVRAISSSDPSCVRQQECMIETAIGNATTSLQDSTCSQSGSSCTTDGGEVKGDDEDFTAEASYTPPLNQSYPAPKAAQGLGSDMGEPQDLDPTYSEMIFERLEKAREYMQSKVMVEDLYKNVRTLCRNKQSACAFWSVLGECDNNPGYMHVNCAPVCETCEMLHIDNRCRLDTDAKDAWTHPGDLNKFFLRIVNDPAFQAYEPTILSKPPAGPWLIQMDNFLSDEEAEHLIALGHEQSYERSSDVGTKQADGTYSKRIYSGRTSTNAWCIGDCYNDPIAQRITERMENVTGIPETNYENLQLLRYMKDEFYNTHNDFIPYQVERPCGPRILTFYMYLNDVEDGGGTNFPELDLTVTPKRGRVALWPSVLDDDPNKIDDRTKHQALPVISGIKYGANAWIHQRDFKGPNNLACT